MGALMDPNHQVAWRSALPDFSITRLRGTSTSRGYHETFYEVVSQRELAASIFARLDECGLLGMGQSYRVDAPTRFTEVVQPVTIDRRTGKIVDVPPLDYLGRVVKGTVDIEWFRYEVLRICDSGD